MQAQQYSVATYISGFVIGVAPLIVTVISPLIGCFVSPLALVAKLNSVLSRECNFVSQVCHKFLPYAVASSSGTEVHTACWTVFGWRISCSVWVF